MRLLAPAAAVGLAALPLAACAPGRAPAGAAADSAAPPDSGAPPDPGAPPAPSLRRTSAGWIEGQPEGEVLAFLGVPFAAPPVGELRWRRPAPPAPWAGVRPARAFGPRCVQAANSFLDEDAPADAWIGDEDCLYLNVWTPDTAGERAGGRPVLVFLHGGGNTYGGTMDPLSTVVHAAAEAADRPLYGGARLAAAMDAVVITTAYRLGPLGYLSHPVLDADGPDGTSGNYGLYDILAALAWVQDNAVALGGDPDRVLLVGQSGGARDALALWTCQSPPGLFAGVAMHSPPVSLDPLAGLRERAAALSAELGCADHPRELACLRAADPGALVTAAAAAPRGLASGAFIPTVDGALCVQQPADALRSGAAAGVPALLGTTDAEYSHRWPSIPEDAYPALVEEAVGAELADEVLDQYSVERFGSATVAYTELMSDRNVTCPVRRTARVAAGAGYTLHHHRFAQVLPEAARIGYGAYHTSDLVYLFQHMDGAAFAPSADDVAAQDAMARYWGRMAAAGDPTGGDDPAWPAYALDAELTLVLTGAPRVQADLKAADCDAWDARSTAG